MKKERDPIDHYFLEALDDYQVIPREEARKTFLDEVAPKPILRRRYWPWLVAVILVVVSASFITILYQRKSGTEYPLPIDGSKKHQRQIKKITDEPPGPGQPENKRTRAIPSIILNPTPASAAGLAGITSNTESVAEKEGQSTEPEIIKATISYPDSSEATAGNNLPPIDQPDSIPPTSPSASVPTGKAKTQKEWRISPGIYYSPEWMFQTLEGTKPVTNFGLEGTFRIDRFSIRTGVGLSITKGTNQLAIAYNDYLGSYMKLDSMTFAWNEQQTDLLPTYYLTNKEVWDSLMKLENAKIIKRYIYLQIPLILGYDIISNKNFSFGFRVGPILSVLLSSKNLSDDFDPAKKQVISINMITPEQISLNWQIMGGLNATYRISRRFGVEIEPFGKYYMNSVYENSGSSVKPWSLGMRVAVFISF